MKYIAFLTVIAAMITVSCGNTRANAGEEQKTGGQTVQEIAEPAVTENTTAWAAETEGGETQSSTTTAKVQGGTKLLTKSEFLKNVWNYEKSPQEWVFLGDKPAIIDFYADWCGPCRTASPILEEVSHEFAGKITVYKIDTQKEQELAAVFGVRSIPAFLYIPKNGKPTMMAGIARTKEDTKKMFVDNINKILLPGN
jgi:thioredoxin